ncbi:hypothetical protein BD289DRAFT_217957 [Coniella lustricola]|uniref:Uncharacterized protein n=1 Tax=Coniella lustricola TaxID=2025994 RepID=A0A2T2ZRY9_9PEZI|nr:hypothetical protein BD289DRAFT_217957 [Coniella lustricola]
MVAAAAAAAAAGRANRQKDSALRSIAGEACIIQVSGAAGGIRKHKHSCGSLVRWIGATGHARTSSHLHSSQCCGTTWQELHFRPLLATVVNVDGLRIAAIVQSRGCQAPRRRDKMGLSWRLNTAPADSLATSANTPSLQDIATWSIGTYGEQKRRRVQPASLRGLVTLLGPKAPQGGKREHVSLGWFLEISSYPWQPSQPDGQSRIIADTKKWILQPRVPGHSQAASYTAN